MVAGAEAPVEVDAQVHGGRRRDPLHRRCHMQQVHLQQQESTKEAIWICSRGLGLGPQQLHLPRAWASLGFHLHGVRSCLAVSIHGGVPTKPVSLGGSPLLVQCNINKLLDLFFS